MALAALAQVAGMAVLDHHVDQRLPAQPVGQLPGLGLVQPHQRRLDGDPRTQPQAQRYLLRLDGVVAAVRVPGKIGFAHAAHQHVELAAITERRGQRQEQQVAARHEGIGQAVGLHLDLAVAGHGGVAHLRQDAQVEQMIVAQALGPVGKVGAQFAQHDLAGIQLDAMPLAVVETQRLDVGIALQRPGQASGGILSAREQHQGASLMVLHKTPEQIKRGAAATA
ncbi:Uncharacterised protein [Bordetella pertussis]|nr:Uncharacterised protein [Bordetella pertussis]